MSDQPPERRIALFQRKEIRRVIHGNEWWFVITDVVTALTDSTNPSDYLKMLRKRDEPLGEAFKGGGQLVPSLWLRPHEGCIQLVLTLLAMVDQASGQFALLHLNDWKAGANLFQ